MNTNPQKDCGNPICRTCYPNMSEEERTARLFGKTTPHALPEPIRSLFLESMDAETNKPGRIKRAFLWLLSLVYELACVYGLTEPQTGRKGLQ